MSRQLTEGVDGLGHRAAGFLERGGLSQVDPLEGLCGEREAGLKTCS